MNVNLMKYGHLDDQEKSVFDEYKASSFKLNNDIRNGNISMSVQILDSLISKYENVHDIVLYRAMPLYCIDEKQVGNIYQDITYLSCSLEKYSIFKFCTEKEMAVLQIYCPASTHMINMDVNPQFADDETEYLLTRNLPLEVNNRSDLTNNPDILEFFDYDRFIAGNISRLVIFEMIVI